MTIFMMLATVNSEMTIKLLQMNVNSSLTSNNRIRSNDLDFFLLLLVSQLRWRVKGAMTLIIYSQKVNHKKERSN